MESPPSCSTWSEAFLLSDDSGLLLTSGSISSGSVNSESRSGYCKYNAELPGSDGEDKSLSQADSLDGMSDGMSGVHFNTLKKGPGNWCDITDTKQILSIEPPPEFQDEPPIYKLSADAPLWIDKLATHLMNVIIDDALNVCCKMIWPIPCSQECHATTSTLKPFDNRYHSNVSGTRLCWTPELLSYSPCHAANRPTSRNSLSSSRLSNSHNSLNISTFNKVDDSNFITQAVSHDVLISSKINDIYNVPFDSDIYAVPIDVVRPRTPPRKNRQLRHQRKRRRHVSAGSQAELAWHVAQARQLVGKPRAVSHVIKSQALLSDVCNGTDGKRHSVPGSRVSQPPETEPIHMTLQEVRQYLQTLYSSSSDSSDCKHNKNEPQRHDSTSLVNSNIASTSMKYENTNIKYHRKYKKSSFMLNLKNKKIKDSTPENKRYALEPEQKYNDKEKKSPAKTFSLNFKQTLCNLFRFKRLISPDQNNSQRILNVRETLEEEDQVNGSGQKLSVQKRALPPLPGGNIPTTVTSIEDEELSMDFASSIEKVKDYGWYWGPISGEAAEKILSNEPDGSFIVRDSSDDHYIFSLTFKLNNCVRHVRIEHDQGNFSFGSCTKFKSHTIVEFIENAVEHSRSGRYLFFLHRRPVLGPMRVQLLHPVSRFKQIQSLQHMCRFVILKLVRRDLIPSLPLPRRIIDYLNTKHYYSEHFIESEESEGSSGITGDDYKTT